MNYNIILASQSPRRQQLLKNLNIEFSTISLNIDENYPKKLKGSEITEYLAEKKSKSFGKIDGNTLVITADTLVSIDNKVLEKPINKEQAIEMLTNLSGKLHQVYTSVGFSTYNSFEVLTDKAEVHFLPILPSEIEYYIDHYEPFDKAGGYGIQDWIGISKIDYINGSYFTVMGFPTHLVYQYLCKNKIIKFK